MRAGNLYLLRRSAFLLGVLALGSCTTADKVELEEYAPQSPDADIEAVSLSASDDDTFDPERVGTEFPDTTKQVAVWYRWDEADSGKKVGIRWSRDGEVVLEQGDTLLKVSGASAYVLKMAAGSKLPIGDYQVELLENGVAVTKIPFKVGAGGADGSEPEMGAAPEEEDAPASVATAEAGPETPPEEAAGSEPVASEPSEEEPSAEVAAVEPQTASLQVGKPAGALAAQETKWPGVVVELTELVRKGSTLYAKLRFTNNGTKEIRPDFYYRDTYVLDQNNKKYEVLKDEKDAYLGSVASGYTYWWADYIDPGASRIVWMRFAPPPVGVKVVSVQVGTMDPFEDVRIQN